MHLFNNCHDRKHPALYGPNAFFDLETSGYQSRVADRLANELGPEENCVVATLDTTGDIKFDWYRFSRVVVKADPERNVNCHASYGEQFNTETLSRAEAIRHRVHGQFFNVNGHFKRPSVIRAY
jgi:hypothetical protein